MKGMKKPVLIFCVALGVVLFACASPAAATNFTISIDDGPVPFIDGGSWDATTKTFTLPPDVLLLLYPGDSLIIDRGVTFRLEGDLYNCGGIIYNYGGRIDNYGTIINTDFGSTDVGSIYIDGASVNGRIDNYGKIINQNEGIIYILNDGGIRNKEDGSIKNYWGGSIYIDGRIDNYGVILNYESSIILVYGYICNYGDIFNDVESLMGLGGLGQIDGHVDHVSYLGSYCNLPPVADPNGPYTGTVGVPLTFDGSGSRDYYGAIVSYHWDFGDGTTGTGVAPTHTYTAEGTYTVTLIVTDDHVFEGFELLPGGYWIRSRPLSAADLVRTTVTVSSSEDIPEFSTIALPVASILGLLFLFNHRKRRKED